MVDSPVVNIKATVAAANELLREIVEVRTTRLRKQDTLDRRVNALKTKHGPEIDILQKQEDALIRQLTGLVLPKFFLLAFKGTKTIKLRSGEISLRDSAEKLVVDDDEKTVIKRIGRSGGGNLTKFTRLVRKRELDKNALKKDPSFVEKIKGIRITRDTTVVIKPSRARASAIELAADKLSVQIQKEE